LGLHDVMKKDPEVRDECGFWYVASALLTIGLIQLIRMAIEHPHFFFG